MQAPINSGNLESTCIDMTQVELQNLTLAVCKKCYCWKCQSYCLRYYHRFIVFSVCFCTKIRWYKNVRVITFHSSADQVLDKDQWRGRIWHGWQTDEMMLDTSSHFAENTIYTMTLKAHIKWRANGSSGSSSNPFSPFLCITVVTWWTQEVCFHPLSESEPNVVLISAGSVHYLNTNSPVFNATKI
jgi:hypothetical protein